ncbi:MAG TPA: Lpg1974 family pore-forming outer membrane protein [Caulobacteraceae bacterium]
MKFFRPDTDDGAFGFISALNSAFGKAATGGKDMTIRRKTSAATASFLAMCLGTSALTPALARAAPAPTEAIQDYEIAAQPLQAALIEFSRQSRSPVVASTALLQGISASAVEGRMNEAQALDTLLAGTGLVASLSPDSGWSISRKAAADPQSGSAAGDGAEGTVEALIVTAQKREEDIQDVPIAISAFTQESLERSQIAGGPDLITQVPNMSFTKTNFSSYSVQIRGIGTQAISATTDPAVAVAMNNTPFIRNRFFEQEFYDLQRLEVLRGPQGTLYGRNATAGVVNIITHKPVFSFEAKLSADVSNYNSTRLEGMVNLPLVEDKVALRLAGAWTKREGYATNQVTGQQIDGRDLWSARASLRFEPTDWISANFIYEHFQEDDDRLRSGKQLCKKHLPGTIGDLELPNVGGVFSQASYLSQGCEAVSLYSDEAFQTPNGFALPYYGAIDPIGAPVFDERDPYVSAVQSRDLRAIESSVEPEYRANTDIVELQVNIDLTPELTLSSETAYNIDALFSLQDFNRFTTLPGAWDREEFGGGFWYPLINEDGEYCDPQLGCSSRLLLVDVSTSDSTQFSQELRLGSDFEGPFNFSLGANFLRHDAEDKYYVFVNSLSLLAEGKLLGGHLPFRPGFTGDTAPLGDPTQVYSVSGGVYIDPNPIGSLNDQGRNYFLSKNPYKLISYAVFGETYYNIRENLKVTAGLRWTVDKKTAPQIPSWLLAGDVAGAYPVAKTLVQEWREPTGRLSIDWKPDLSFTDETMVYASFAHGYKAGGANPPPPVLVAYGADDALAQEILPDTFEPEFLNAYEIGAKNTLLDGQLTLNTNIFYYDYTGYQTSEIRNRSAVNSNYDAEVWGAEVEIDWRPVENLKLGFKGGYNGTRIADGEKAIDLMDRTAGNPDWVVVKPFPTIPSNCIAPVDVVTAGGIFHAGPFNSTSASGVCLDAYYFDEDPITGLPYDPSITDYSTAPKRGGGVLGPDYADYHGFDPSTAPNGGRGFDKQLGGNELPNAPEFTTTITADYTLPLPNDWLATLHADYHWQSESWGRVFNSAPYDKIESFSLVNLAAIFTNEDAGWKVMAYVKNVLDETAITGAFLFSDDTGLTTNVFLTEPRLYGLRVTKDFAGGAWFPGLNPASKGPFPLTVEIGGSTNRYLANNEDYHPTWMDEYLPDFPMPASIQNNDLDWSDGREVKLTYRPNTGPWTVSAAYRTGDANASHTSGGATQAVEGGEGVITFFGMELIRQYISSPDNHWRGAVHDREEHQLVDFVVGRDFGMGWLSKSTFAAGVRYATFGSDSKVLMDGIPNIYVPDEWQLLDPKYGIDSPQPAQDHHTTSLTSRREFEGYGPQLSWDAAVQLWGDEENGHADLDWTLSGGVLFGQQDVNSVEDRVGTHYFGGQPDTTGEGLIQTFIQRSNIYPGDAARVVRTRSRDVTASTLGVSLGLSYEVQRVKVSTGYRYDRFFDVIDGGYEDASSKDRAIHGPYLKLAIGFGG